MNYDKVYDTFLYASNTLGKIIEQDKSKGHIVVNLNTILNPVRADIKIIKQNAIQTIVEISSFCKTDGLSVVKTSFKWKEKLLEEVYEKLDIHKEKNNEEKANEQQKLLYKKSRIKSKSKKNSFNIFNTFYFIRFIDRRITRCNNAGFSYIYYTLSCNIFLCLYFL